MLSKSIKQDNDTYFIRKNIIKNQQNNNIINKDLYTVSSSNALFDPDMSCSPPNEFTKTLKSRMNTYFYSNE